MSPKLLKALVKRTMADPMLIQFLATGAPFSSAGDPRSSGAEGDKKVSPESGSKKDEVKKIG